MIISNHSVVTLNFTAKTTSGQVIDSSEERKEPLHVLIGAENIIEGLEEALIGRQAGELFTVDIPAHKAYGELSDELIQSAPIEAFQSDTLNIGDRFTAMTEDGEEISVKVTSIDENIATVDGNHDLAGVDLSFEVEIIKVREASPTELEIGQAIEDE